MATLIHPGSVQRTVLPNGLTVLLRPDHSAPVVAVVTHVKAGYFDETDDVVGIAHVLEHMFFKGTERRAVGEIAKETKASGGYLNAHTIYDNTAYFTVLPASGLDAGLDIQADAYANSLIDAAELAKELEVIIQEAKRKADNPSALAEETLYELIHDAHRIRRWRIGREAGLRRLTRDALVSFYRNFYRPSNTILSIVGDLDAQRTMARVSELYGSLADSEPVRSLHPDPPALDFAASLLGTGRASRLYRALRERQLASSVSAYNYSPTELGVFTVHAEINPERATDAAIAIAEQVRALRKETTRTEDMERVRTVFDARWTRRLETMEGQANHLAEWEALGDWELAEGYRATFMSATADDVQRVASDYLAAGRTGVLLYRPESSPAVAANAREMQDLLESGHAEPLEALPRRPAIGLSDPGWAPTFERETAGVLRFRSNTGLPVLVHRKPDSAIVHLGVFAFGGSCDEPSELAGITTLVARSMVKGSRRRSAAQLAEDVEMLGGTISASVSLEGFGWSISVPSQHLAPAAEILGDVIQNAALGEDAIETERSVALADVIAVRDDMYRYPVRLAMCAAFKGQGVAPTQRSSVGGRR